MQMSFPSKIIEQLVELNLAKHMLNLFLTSLYRRNFCHLNHGRYLWKKAYLHSNSFHLYFLHNHVLIVLAMLKYNLEFVYWNVSKVLSPVIFFS